jgi:hypothetical protein
MHKLRKASTASQSAAAFQQSLGNNHGTGSGGGRRHRGFGTSQPAARQDSSSSSGSSSGSRSRSNSSSKSAAAFAVTVFVQDDVHDIDEELRVEGVTAERTWSWVVTQLNAQLRENVAHAAKGSGGRVAMRPIAALQLGGHELHGGDRVNRAFAAGSAFGAVHAIMSDEIGGDGASGDDNALHSRPAASSAKLKRVSTSASGLQRARRESAGFDSGSAAAAAAAAAAATAAAPLPPALRRGDADADADGGASDSSDGASSAATFASAQLDPEPGQRGGGGGGGGGPRGAGWTLPSDVHGEGRGDGSGGRRNGARAAAVAAPAVVMTGIDATPPSSRAKRDSLSIPYEEWKRQQLGDHTHSILAGEEIAIGGHAEKAAAVVVQVQQGRSDGSSSGRGKEGGHGDAGDGGWSSRHRRDSHERREEERARSAAEAVMLQPTRGTSHSRSRRHHGGGGGGGGGGANNSSSGGDSFGGGGGGGRSSSNGSDAGSRRHSHDDDDEHSTDEASGMEERAIAKARATVARREREKATRAAEAAAAAAAEAKEARKAQKSSAREAREAQKEQALEHKAARLASVLAKIGEEDPTYGAMLDQLSPRVRDKVQSRMAGKKGGALTAAAAVSAFRHGAAAGSGGGSKSKAEAERMAQRAVELEVAAAAAHASAAKAEAEAAAAAESANNYRVSSTSSSSSSSRRKKEKGRRGGSSRRQEQAQAAAASTPSHSRSRSRSARANGGSSSRVYRQSRHGSGSGSGSGSGNNDDDDDDDDDPPSPVPPLSPERAEIARLKRRNETLERERIEMVELAGQKGNGGPLALVRDLSGGAEAWDGDGEDVEGGEAVDHEGLSPKVARGRGGKLGRAANRKTPRAGGGGAGDGDGDGGGDGDDEEEAAIAARAAKREMARRASSSSESHSMGLLIGGFVTFLALGCTVLLMLGSGCIVTRDSYYCGAGGLGGGVAMVTVGALAIVGGGVRLLWFTYEPDAVHFGSAFVIALVFASGEILGSFGMICVAEFGQPAAALAASAPKLCGGSGGTAAKGVGVMLIVLALALITASLALAGLLAHNDWLAELLRRIAHSVIAGFCGLFFGALPPMLLSAGIVCIGSGGTTGAGEHQMCGAGGLRGGKAMVGSGSGIAALALGSAQWVLARRSDFAATPWARVIAASFYGGGLLLTSFGSACLEDGELCGPAGQPGGGVAMVVLGGVALAFGLRLAYGIATDRKYAADVNDLAQPLVVFVVGTCCAVAPVLMVGFGSTCAARGAHCGPAGDPDGGVSMLALGVLGTLALALVNTHYFTARGTLAMSSAATAIGGSFVVGELLATLGAVCVDSGGAQMCGAGGYDGGVAMAVIGGLMLAAAIIGFMTLLLWSEQAANAMHALFGGAAAFVVPLVMSVAPPLMLSFGATCVTHERHCGVGGNGGGVSMIVLGALATLGVAWAYLASSSSVDEERAAVSLFCAGVYALGEVLCVFGALCLEMPGGGDASYDGWCGAGGRGGGEAMAAIGALALAGAVGGALRCHADANAARALAPWAGLAAHLMWFLCLLAALLAPMLLTFFGAVCEARGVYCGAAGHDGGTAMYALGIISTVGFTVVLYRRLGADGTASVGETLSEKHHNGIIILVLYVASELLGAYGTLCLVDVDGVGSGVRSISSPAACAGGGRDGGVVMLVAAAAAALVSLGMAIYLLGADDAAHETMAAFSRPASLALTALGVTCGPPLLLSFGATCVANGSFCGVASGAVGAHGRGVAMLTVGAFGALGVCAFQPRHTAALAYCARLACAALAMGFPLTALGAVCVDSGGATHCGAGGLDGGLAMVVLGALLLLGGLALRQVRLLSRD